MSTHLWGCVFYNNKETADYMSAERHGNYSTSSIYHSAIKLARGKYLIWASEESMLLKDLKEAKDEIKRKAMLKSQIY